MTSVRNFSAEYPKFPESWLIRGISERRREEEKNEKESIFEPGYRNVVDFFETLGESLLYGLIIAKNVWLLNKQTSSEYTQNSLFAALSKNHLFMITEVSLFFLTTLTF